jgi:hypothetical protein
MADPDLEAIRVRLNEIYRELVDIRAQLPPTVSGLTEQMLTHAGSWPAHYPIPLERMPAVFTAAERLEIDRKAKEKEQQHGNSA